MADLLSRTEADRRLNVENQTMNSEPKKKLPNAIRILLMLALSCSGQNNGLRSTTTDHPSNDNKGDDGTGKDGNPSENRHDNIAKAADVIPITGINLTQVLVYAACVSDAQNSCKSVRLGANIKVNSESPIRFAADTVMALGIKSSSWKFSDLPSGVSCQSTVDGFAYNPLCTASSSLAAARIKATLTLTATDGATAKGDSPNTAPTNDIVIVGNFMKISEVSGGSNYGLTGLKASGGSPYLGASSAFTQIWQDLVSGHYLTNILYDGGGVPSGTGWDKSTSLCASLDSGDGAGKWHLPSIEDLCGSGYASYSCNGGFYAHDIKNVAFAGGDWAAHNFWSSSPVAGASTQSWSADMLNGNSINFEKFDTNERAVCVR